MIDRVHIFGASGSGTSTIGGTLAKLYSYAHLDTDTYFWQPSDPPFQRQQEAGARAAMLTRAVDTHSRWILSGSIMSWGEAFIERFQLAIFLHLPAEVRLARLRARELELFGTDALAPGGKMNRVHAEFMEWASSYDDGGDEVRSRHLHEKWIARLPCPCVRVDSSRPLHEVIAELTEILGIEKV